MLRHKVVFLLPFAALLLVGCPGSGDGATGEAGAGGDNFLIGKWTAPEPCVLPENEFTANSNTSTTRADSFFPAKTYVIEVSYQPDGRDRMFVRAVKGAVNSVPYRRIDADRMVNESDPSCTYTRAK